MKRRVRTYSGVKTREVRPVELEHRKIARRAAAEGMVLLKNEGLLPMKEGQTAALYGIGTGHLIKGGTGSGDVNEREVVSLYQGMKNAGITIINEADASTAEERYNTARFAWRDSLLQKLAEAKGGSDMGFFGILIGNPFREPELTPIREEEVKAADVCIYTISRVAGEGSDRHDTPGDYYLSEKEKADLQQLSEMHDQILVLLNLGAQIDVKELEANPSVKAILNVSQSGMEGGNAIADVISGKVTPSGKLTSTWAVNYGDFPNSATFSHNNGDTTNERYEEGIYVGYRYFDSFGKEVQYPFGYGLSYTTFALSDYVVSCDSTSVTVSVTVTNTGKTYSGKEVVFVFAACPQESLKKEYKRLIGFGKTKELAPGEKQTLTITSQAKTLASLHSGDPEASRWIVEKGLYGILVGDVSDQTAVAGILEAEQDYVMEEVSHICPLQTELKEIERPDAVVAALTGDWMAEAKEAGLAPIAFAPAPEKNEKQPAHALDAKAREIAEKLTEDELIALLIGEITKGQDNLKEDELVQTGIFVPGAAGETTCQLEEKYDVPAISMADGPAGLRVLRKYDVDKATGFIYSQSLMAALDGGLFAMEHIHENVDTYYMYATAIPIGTMLAQTFDPALCEEIGQMVGQEMEDFGISWWLAPGMNIHRNPLCGRNFEYYSEDPLVAGVIAAAITRGVQSLPGIGTTIKHYACNNQEDNRLFSNSIISERALREIYLRGFEIAIKSAQPMCIMTSYNMVNGVATCNSKDLIDTAARGEWDYQGIVMTDWTPTTAGCGVSHLCTYAGNDLIMPGNQIDVDEIRKSLRDGSLSHQDAVDCAARMIRVIWQTIGMEDPAPYGGQYPNLPYIMVR